VSDKKPSSPVPKPTPASAPRPKVSEATKTPGAPPWFSTLRGEPPRWMAYALGAMCVVVVALVWQSIGGSEGTSRELILPKPGAVLGSYSKLDHMGLYNSIWVSLRRVLIGFAWATGIGVGLGILGGSFRAVGAFFAPVVTFLRSLPMGAVVPLTMIWFGIGEQQKEMFIFIATVPFIMSSTIQAIAAVPQRYIETAQTLGATRWQIIRKVLVPLALPDIMTSLRFLFGLAFGYIMLAEAINPQAGLGYLINLSNSRGGSQEPVFLLLLIIGVLAWGFDWTLRFFQRGIFPYRKDL
jgi:NitT/TauT family transport system permease protein